MRKFRENAKKTCFFGIFLAFSAGKICFSKIGLRYISGIAILHQCAKFDEKNIKYSSRNSINTVFRRKSAVPAIFREFRLRKSVLLTIKSCLMMGIVINNVFCEKIKKYHGKKYDENLQKRRLPAYFQHFRPEQNFSQKSDSAMF